MASANRKSGLKATLLLTASLATPLLLAPPIIRGLAADAWVKYDATLESLPRPRKTAARTLVEKTELAIWNLAPLPQASTAAIRALEIGQRLEQQDKDVDAALVIYQGVRAACAQTRNRPFAGAGFAVIEARAAALEGAARRAKGK